MAERNPYPLLHVKREHALFDDSEASFVVAWHKRKNADDVARREAESEPSDG